MDNHDDESILDPYAPSPPSNPLVQPIPAPSRGLQWQPREIAPGTVPDRPDPWAVLKALKAMLVQPNRTSDVGVVR